MSSILKQCVIDKWALFFALGRGRWHSGSNFQCLRSSDESAEIGFGRSDPNRRNRRRNRRQRTNSDAPRTGSQPGDGRTTGRRTGYELQTVEAALASHRAEQIIFSPDQVVSETLGVGEAAILYSVFGHYTNLWDRGRWRGCEPRTGQQQQL